MSAKRKQQKPASVASALQPNSAILVVGIAASAGGLKAFRELLPHLPVDDNIAYVLIQHLAPSHESQLAEILSRDSKLSIAEATDGIQILPAHCYVIPPGQQLYLLHDKLHLMPRANDEKRYYPADAFFESLAADRGAAAIGVILSGTGADGTQGLGAIKAAGGLTFAQSSETADFAAMPENASAAGCVDFILSPAEIAHEITRLAGQSRHISCISHDKADDFQAINRQELDKIFILLRSRSGHDFSGYKLNTIKRRIHRRMMVHKLERTSEYLMMLQKDVHEIDQLYQDLLINVTAFFRDPETFSALQETVFPEMVKNCPEGESIRIWVPGCSSGEEVYSMAMEIDEFLGDRASRISLQIFGSDIDELAINKARAGRYPESIIEQVSRERLQRYFHPVNGGYQINKTLRDRCIFSLQSVTRDPPFSRIDLISCRNLLIYLGNELQKKVLKIFHYALQPEGYLMLGSSESIGSYVDLFAMKNKKTGLYQKKSVANRFSQELFLLAPEELADKTWEVTTSAKEKVYDMEDDVRHALLETYAPPGVLIDGNQMVIRFLGRTWPYIEHGEGNASLNLYKIVHSDLIVELRAGLHAARKSGSEVIRDNLRLKMNDKEKILAIRIIPLGVDSSSRNNMLVMFEPRPDVTRLTPQDALVTGNAESLLQQLTERNGELERELASTREYMQSIIEEQEGTNEELRSANEEIQSTNEELQSINEELETAKEELQSTNEELATVNEELETRNDELAQTNDDLSNLLANVNLPVIMLGADLCIRQFTSPAESLLNLIPTDLGRPIGNIKPNIELPDLEKEVVSIINTIDTRSFESRDKDGHWYSVRMRPYKTQDRHIDGVVITFVEIDSQKDLERLEKNLEQERRLSTIVRDSSDAITMQDFDGNILAWNPAAGRLYGYSEEEALQMNIRQLVFDEDLTILNTLLQSAMTGRSMPAMELKRRRKDGSRANIWLTASVLLDSSGKPQALATTEKLL